MDPVLMDVYSTILPAAPFVIGAYALMWLVLLAYVVIIVAGLKKTEKRLAALEDSLGDASAQLEA